MESRKCRGRSNAVIRLVSVCWIKECRRVLVRHVPPSTAEKFINQFVAFIADEAVSTGLVRPFAAILLRSFRRQFCKSRSSRTPPNYQFQEYLYMLLYA